MLALSAGSGRLAARIGPRPQLFVGPLLLAVGFVLLSRLGAEAPYLTEVLPGVLLVALGLSTTVAPLTATVLASAPQRHAGLASGVNNTFARGAQLIGVAAVPVLAGIGGTSGEGADMDPASIARGFGTAMLILAGLCVLAALCALLLPRGRMPGAAEVAEAPAEERPLRFCGASGPPLRSCPGSHAGE